MRTRGLLAAGFLMWALAFGYAARALPGVAAAATQPPGAQAPDTVPAAPTDADCLECHDDPEAVREDGTSVAVRPAVVASSIHADMGCVDCHDDPAITEMPHPERLQRVECGACHSDSAELFAVSVHATAREAGSEVAASCVSCHGAHDIRASGDPDSRTHHLNIAGTCGSCHGDADLIAKGAVPRDVTDAFADSIHATMLARSGLMDAPTCSSCHGAHEIRSPHDPESRVGVANVPNTCGTCHEGVARQFQGGVHAAMLKAGETAPACQTCHTAHSIPRAEHAAWQLSVINQCGTCHAERVGTFRDTFHGKVTTLGSRSVAGCADCHGAHEVLPASDPRSPIAPANLVQTCRQCHPNANENFVQYDPHADKGDRDRNPALFYTARFMTLLLAGVFSFFGLHTVLWFGREMRERHEDQSAHHGGDRALPGSEEP